MLHNEGDRQNKTGYRGHWSKDWIDLAQDREEWEALANTVKNFRVQQSAGNVLSSRGTVNFWRPICSTSSFVRPQFVHCHLLTFRPHNCARHCPVANDVTTRAHLDLVTSVSTWSRAVSDSDGHIALSAAWQPEITLKFRNFSYSLCSVEPLCLDFLLCSRPVRLLSVLKCLKLFLLAQQSCRAWRYRCALHWSLLCLIDSLQPSGYCTYRQFNIQQFHVLPTHCIYVFCVDLRTNSNYFPIQH